MPTLLFRLCLLVFFISCSSLKACGYFILGEDFRIALLNPYLIGEDYSAFFYSADYLNHRTNAQAGNDRLRNAAAWATELNRKYKGERVTATDVMDILYGTELVDWLNARDGKGKQPGWDDNPAWLAISQRPDLLEYLLYAKGYESPAEPVYEWWDEPAEETPDPRTVAYTTDYHARALAGYQQARKNSFLQERYAYQLLLLAYYANDEEEMENYFLQHFHRAEGPLADWARFHFAGQWNEEGRYLVEMANALRAVPEKALAVYARTDRQIIPANYLSAAKSDEERSNVYALAALKQKGRALANLREAYRLDPTNPIVELLLVREFNKLEDWLMSFALTGLGPAVPTGTWPTWGEDLIARQQEVRAVSYQENRQYLKEFRTFINTYQTGKAATPFAQVLRAQAALLDEDYPAALQLTENLPEDDSDLGRQVQVIRYLALLQGGNLADPQVKNDVARRLLTLDALLAADRPADAYYDPRKHKLPPTLSRAAARAFAQAGDTVSAYFLHNRSLDLQLGDTYRSEFYDKIEYLDRPLNPEIIEKVILLVSQADTSTLFGRVLQSAALPEVAVLHDLAGTLALRRNDLQGAWSHFSKLPAEWHQQHQHFGHYRYTYGDSEVKLWANPFTDMIGGGDPEPSLSKLNIVNQLLDLERISRQGGIEGANACLVLAEAWYNMSDFGDAWDLLSYGKSVVVPAGPTAWPNGYNHAGVPHSQHDYDLIHLASRSAEYLECAAAGATDPTLQAKIDLSQRVLAYRQFQKKMETANYGYLAPEDQEKLAVAYEQLLTPFVDRYGKTAYYQQIIMQCSSISSLED